MPAPIISKTDFISAKTAVKKIRILKYLLYLQKNILC